MPETIDWDKLTPKPRRGRGKLFLLIAVVAVILLFGRTAISFWVDLLWFKSLGYGEVFWKSRGLEWGIFAGFFTLTFLILFGIFSALKHAHENDLPSDHTIYIGGQPVNLSLKPVLRIVSIGGSLAVALLTGGTVTCWGVSFAPGLGPKKRALIPSSGR